MKLMQSSFMQSEGLIKFCWIKNSFSTLCTKSTKICIYTCIDCLIAFNCVCIKGHTPLLLHLRLLLQVWDVNKFKICLTKGESKVSFQRSLHRSTIEQPFIYLYRNHQIEFSRKICRFCKSLNGSKLKIVDSWVNCSVKFHWSWCLKLKSYPETVSLITVNACNAVN